MLLLMMTISTAIVTMDRFAIGGERWKKLWSRFCGQKDNNLKIILVTMMYLSAYFWLRMTSGVAAGDDGYGKVSN